jgi:tripartite-type tricarboxylate transporter receptor subunit TctC
MRLMLASLAMRLRLLVCVLPLVAAMPLQAQDAYPSRPITVLVPFPPGSGSDLIPRTLTPLMSQSMNVPILVENRPGAGGSVGAGTVAKAKPDGYTILMAPTPVLAVNKWLYKDLAYDPERDFALITNAAATPNLLVVHPSIAAGTLKELIEQAKRESLSFASGGSGTTSHLCGELLKTYAKIDMVHVPYKGPGPAVQDLLAGRVPVMCDNLSNVISHVRAGKLKAIALAAKARHPQAPNVPTSEEAGLPGFEAGVWYSFAAPAGTPRPVIDRLNAEFAKALRNPQVADRFRDLGLSIVADSPEDFARFVAAESAKWKRIVEVSGAKVD